MAIPPRLFIASSTAAKTLADELENALNQSNEVEAKSWANSSQLSRNLLDTLIRSSKHNDFAVVILTGDDTLKRSDDDREVAVPRDNCIFELGLFIGAFGNPERCLLLSSLDPKVLFDQLSDIAGQLHLKMDQPNLDDVEQCRSVAAENVAPILEVVREHKRFADRPRLPGFKIDDILEMEADRKRVQDDDLVLVKERLPPETKLHYARVVLDNMGRLVNYLYLFDSKQPVSKIVEMLRSLLAAEVLAEERYEGYDRTGNNEKKKEVFIGQAKRLETTITTLRAHLFIDLVRDVEFDEFCIHSAGADYVKGYAKLKINETETRYVPLPKDATRLRFDYKGYDAKKDWPTKVIFDLVASDDKRTDRKLRQQQRARVTKQIRKKFPAELHEPLIQACFIPEEESD